MPLTKHIVADWSQTGETVYCIVQRDADFYYLDNTTGGFTDTPVSAPVPMFEDTIIKGRYKLSENRSVWNDGKYYIAIYKQLGGSPSPVADLIISSVAMWIGNDADLSLDSFNGLAAIKAQTDLLTFDASNNIKSVQQYPTGAVVDDPLNDAANFITNLTETADNHWKDSWLKFTSGSLISQVRKVIAYVGSTKRISFSAPGFTSVPAPADTFKLIDE
jgi:hypothetical protein